MTEKASGAEHLSSPQLSGEIVSGRNMTAIDLAHAALLAEKGVMLDRANLAPGLIEAGGTEIVLQRHGKYIRDRENPAAGSLTPESIEIEAHSAVNYFTQLFEPLSDKEKAETYLLLVSSDTSYANGGRRSYETTSIVQEVAETIFEENGVSKENILNLSHKLDKQGQPRPMAQLREPQFFEKSPNFAEFLKGKYGDLGQEFWLAFEEDTERDVRLDMGAEGPDEIADRMKKAVKVLSRYASLFHAEKPDSRLIIWVGTHYDTISPFVKRDILHQDKTAAVLVDYGGGLTIDVDAHKQASANIGGQKCSFGLEA